MSSNLRFLSKIRDSIKNKIDYDINLAEDFRITFYPGDISSELKSIIYIMNIGQLNIFFDDCNLTEILDKKIDDSIFDDIDNLTDIEFTLKYGRCFYDDKFVDYINKKLGYNHTIEFYEEFLK